MSLALPFRRASPRPWGWLAVVALAVAGAPPAAAQARPDTVPRDTVRRDTVRVPIPPVALEPDTLPADSLVGGDSAVVVPPFPRFPDARPAGWAFARWEWDREALLRFHGLSLLDLLEQVPGLVATRAGDFGVPAGVSALGLGGARLRVFVDGWELDPLGGTTLDVQQLGLAELESVRVQRGPAEVRVELIPMRVDSAGPLSLVEAGTGNYEYKMLRAMLARPVGRRSIVSGAYDLVSTGGFGFRSPSSVTAARAAWSYALSENTGLQLEYRGEGVRSTAVPYPAHADRRALLLRARSRIRPGLSVDAMLGRTTRAPGAEDTLTVGLASIQGALRGALVASRGGAEAAVRLRSGSETAVARPALEVTASGYATPAPWLVGSAQVRIGGGGGAGGVEWSGTARAGRGLAAFVTVSGGQQALGLVRDTVRLQSLGTFEDVELVDTIVEPRYSFASTGVALLRGGAEWVGRAGSVGVAAVAVGGGQVAPFGLAFDRGAAPLEVGSATGLEARGAARVPGTRGAARVEGWFTEWTQRGGRPYLPRRQATASLVLRDVFYDGQLEPTLRLDVRHRGSTLSVDPDRRTFTGTVAPYTVLDAFLQIRILEVRAFLVYQRRPEYPNVFDVPGRRLPGELLYYGLRWIFRD